MSYNKNEINKEELSVMLPSMDKGGDKKGYISGKTSIVLIGANGVGKTRMSSWVEKNIVNSQSQDVNAINAINVHRITAQKSLIFPDRVDSMNSKEAREAVLCAAPRYSAKYAFRERREHLSNYRYNGDSNTGQLNDAEQLINFLVSENAEKGLAFMEGYKKRKTNHSSLDDTHLEESCMDIIEKVWNLVIPDKKLDVRSGSVFVTVNDNGEDRRYNICQLSDGEREVFYLLGEVLLVQPRTLIIIDEPEEHLHKALLNRFWNEVEKLRSDCMFMYITHDYDFALSRANSELIWVHGIHGNTADENDSVYWDYESLTDWKEKAHGTDEETDAYMALMLEICGSSKDVLFVEGDPGSIDHDLYSRVYPDYNVIPVGSCERVIQAVRGSRELQNVHPLNVYGIIDGDRRSYDEISALHNNGIIVLNVAQVENLFVEPDVVSLIYKHVGSRKSLEAINESIKKNTLRHLARPDVSNKQILLFTKEKLKRNIDAILYDEGMSRIREPDDFYEALKKSFDKADLDFAKIAKSEEDEIKDAIEREDFDKALMLDSNKGLLNDSKVGDAFDWDVQGYIDHVLLYLENGCDISSQLRDAFKGYIGLE